MTSAVDPALPVAVVLVLIDCLIAFVFGVLYHRSRERYLVSWCAAFCCAVISHSGVATSLLTGGGGGFEAVGWFFLIGVTLFMVAGTDLFVGRPVRWRWAVLSVLASLWGGIALLLDLPFVFRSLLGIFVLVAALVDAAKELWRRRQSGSIGTYVAIAGLLLSGLHFLNFPFLGDEPSAVPWGLAVAAATLLMIGLGFAIAAVEAAQRLSQEADRRYRDFFEHAAIGAYRSTLDGEFTAANPKLAQILGYDSVEDLYELRVAEDLFTDASDRKRLQSQGKDEISAVPLVWKRKDGSLVHIELHGRRARTDDRGPDHYEGFVVDVTEAKKLEERLLLAEKLDAIGQLAGGVAHDFNNLLTIIMSSAALLKMRLDRDSALHGVASNIDIAAQRGAELTSQLLAYARRQPMQPVVIDLSEAMDSTISLMRRTLPESIAIVTHSVPSCWVLADRGHLQQVLMNLMINARNAMPEGGELRLSLERRRLAAQELQTQPDADDVEYAVLRVVDTGEGMTAAVQARIFEPFYTTRKVGEGTGLGLASVYGIVTRVRGFVTVDSAPGRGSTFSVFWPTTEEPARAAAAVGDRAVVPSGLRCLLVEDEELLRASVRQMLDDIGSTVTEAKDGARALEVIRELDALDLVVTDVVMPGKGGIEVARAARERFPDAAILCMSGYTGHSEEDAKISEIADAFIAKPFAADDFMQAVARAVASKRRRDSVARAGRRY